MFVRLILPSNKVDFFSHSVRVSVPRLRARLTVSQRLRELEKSVVCFGDPRGSSLSGQFCHLDTETRFDFISQLNTITH